MRLIWSVCLFKCIKQCWCSVSSKTIFSCCSFCSRLITHFSYSIPPQIAISKCQCVSEFQCFYWNWNLNYTFWLSCFSSHNSHHHLFTLLPSTSCMFTMMVSAFTNTTITSWWLRRWLVCEWVSEWNCVFQELSNVKKWASTFTKLRH